MTDSPRKELQLFDALPDEAIVSSRIAGIILDLSERTIRYHPHLRRIWTSTGRYGFQVGEVRKLAREGVPS
jgi:hypothetical protein